MEMDTVEIDCYAILGIAQNASISEIKKAYRLKAVERHPDKNPNNPVATSLFQELVYAFDILSDLVKRRTYDLRYPDIRRKCAAAVEELKRQQAAKDAEEKRKKAARDEEAKKEEAERKIKLAEALKKSEEEKVLRHRQNYEADKASSELKRRVLGKWKADILSFKKEQGELQNSLDKVLSDQKARKEEYEKSKNDWDNIMAKLTISIDQLSIKKRKTRHKVIDEDQEAHDVLEKEELQKINLLRTKLEKLSLRFTTLQDQIKSQQRDIDELEEKTLQFEKDEDFAKKEEEAAKRAAQEAEKARLDRERLQKEAAEWIRSETERIQRAAAEKLRQTQEAERAAQKAIKRSQELLERLRKEQKEYNEKRQAEERERIFREAEILAAAAREQERVWKQREEQRQEEERQRQERRQSSASSYSSSSTTRGSYGCSHSRWWSKVYGGGDCDRCERDFPSFLYQCPDCNLSCCYPCVIASRDHARY